MHLSGCNESFAQILRQLSGGDRTTVPIVTLILLLLLLLPSLPLLPAVAAVVKKRWVRMLVHRMRSVNACAGMLVPTMTRVRW